MSSQPNEKHPDTPPAGDTVSLERLLGALPQQPAEAAPAGTGTVSIHPVDGGIPAPVSSPTSQDLPEKISRFEIREFLGEGAFGVVYRAYDPSLKREVALKVAKPERLHSPQRIERFQREAQAAAHLMHPHIVPVFDHGQDGPHHYLATAFIQGHSLAHVLGALPEGQTLPLGQGVQIVRKLAEALAHAHQQKVIHRDVKPANVMLREDGEPLLMDFGLAARTEGEEKLTQAGMALGTPEYMAPEQWQGKAEAVSDQYSLGCLLFELLTGQLPFSGGTPEHYLYLHTKQPAPSPRKFNRQLPRDLETICLKCLEKEAGKRYVDCQELAADLRRWQDREPIKARPIGTLERLSKWARRRPALAAAYLLGGVVLLLGGLGGGAAWLWQRAEGALKTVDNLRQQAEQDRDRISDLQKQVLHGNYLLRVAMAEHEWAANRGPRAEQLLDDCPAEFRHWEWHYLDRLCRAQATVRVSSEAKFLAYSADGTRLASAHEDGTIKLWDGQTRRELLSFRAHDRSVTSLAFNEKGTLLASAGKEGKVKVWDLTASPPVVRLERSRPSGGGNGSVAFSPDGKRVAASIDVAFLAQPDGRPSVVIWEVSTGREALALSHQKSARCLAFTPDGQRLATVHSRARDGWLDPDFGRDVGPGEVILWDAASGRELFKLNGHTLPVHSLAFSPDGEQVATGGVGGNWSQPGRPPEGPLGELRLWNAKTGAFLRSLPAQDSPINAIAFSSDSKRLASASGDASIPGLAGPGKALALVTVWDVATGKERAVFKGHNAPVWAVAFQPGTGVLASGGKDLTLRFWDTGIERGSQQLTTPGEFILAQFSPCGRFLVAVSDTGGAPKPGQSPGGLVRCFDARSGRFRSSWSIKEGSPIIGLFQTVTFTPDGGQLAVLDRTSTLTLRDTVTGRPVKTFPVPGDMPGPVAFSSDGRLVCAGCTKVLKVWQYESGREVLSIQSTSGFRSVAFSPENGRLMGSGNDGRVRFWDVATGQELLTIEAVCGQAHPVIGFMYLAVLSPDGKYVATCSLETGEQAIQLWDAQTGQLLRTLRGHTSNVCWVAFSPDGERLVSGSDDQTVKLWDVATGLETLSLRTDSSLMSVAFSPDGRRIAAGGKSLQVWDATPLPGTESKR